MKQFNRAIDSALDERNLLFTQVTVELAQRQKATDVGSCHMLHAAFEELRHHVLVRQGKHRCKVIVREVRFVRVDEPAKS